MAVERRQWEEPNGPQRHAEKFYLEQTGFSEWGVEISRAFCALSSTYSYGWLIYNTPNWRIELTILFLLCLGNDIMRPSFSLYLMPSYRRNGTLWDEVILVMSFITAALSCAALAKYHFWIFPALVIAQCMCIGIPVIIRTSGYAYESAPENPIIYTPQQGVINPQPIYQPQPIPDPQFLADVQQKPQEWIWSGMIPKGGLTVLSGPPGVGKSLVGKYIAAKLSAGGELPDGSRARMRALVIELEEDAERTTAPDLTALGADPRNLVLQEHPQTVPELDKNGQIQIDKTGQPKLMPNVLTLDLLKHYIAMSGGAGFVVLSPAPVLLGGISLPAEIVTARLDPLVKFAVRSGITLLGITHPPMSGNSKKITGGSAVYDKLSRMILTIEPLENSDVKVLMSGKTSIVKAAHKYPYVTIDKTRGNINAKSIEWLDLSALQEIDETSRQTFYDAPRQNERRVQNLDSVLDLEEYRQRLDFEPESGPEYRLRTDDWLEFQLKNGPRLLQDILDSAEREGYSRSTLFNAASRLRVDRRKIDSQRVEWRLRRN